jgi:hypothetical protein
MTVTTTPFSGPSNGTLLLADDRTLTYINGGTETSSDSFVYEVCDDGSPVECATATVSIAIADTAQVTVTLTGNGAGRVISDPGGIDCGEVCVASFPGGPVVLTPQAGAGSAFLGFSGDSDCTDGVLAATQDITCVARFDLVVASATLTVTLGVLSDPAGIVCPGDCSADYAIPSRVELFATADPGSTLAGWTGDADCLDGFVEVRADLTCTALFDLLPPPPASFTLHLDFQGGGVATVTSNPAGVRCEEDCDVDFPQGQTLTLFVRPVAGTFVSWGGDCHPRRRQDLHGHRGAVGPVRSRR